MTVTPEFAADALTEALREGAAGEFAPAHKPPAASTSRSIPEQNGIKLHGTRPPVYEVLTEKPEHLVIAYMAATGMSQKEICQRMHRTPTAISNLFRQPWFMERVTGIISEQGKDVVSELISGAAVDSVIKLINLRDFAKDEKVQQTTCIDLLNRYMGKSPAPIKPDDGSLSDPVAEAARIARELGAIDAAEKLNTEQ